MVSADREVKIAAAVHAEFIAIWRDLLAKPLAEPKTWGLRDFHSPNLIWLDART